ncbi:Crp/Fnr family transcriptional regulator [Archangium sp.]|uniref:Crp/Fnr family transcriptional regulator n=1 Tax=Archangium sp. TaxID=1872627 RepID=UPI002D5330C6|nr:Crp/Fnr family transcriptional regulator [Archangium sp.]HYO56379.1 Crp/Fnr family transcriptional regulator [Archangium sp.]
MVQMNTVALPHWAPLEACSPTTRTRLAIAARSWSLPAGEPLLTAGLEAEGLLLLSQGVVRIFHTLAEDCQFTVKLVRAPGSLGLIEVVRGTCSAASVEALTPVEGVHIPAGVLREALAEDNAFTLAALGDMAARFEGTIHHCRALGFETCEQRLIRVLLEYAEHFGRPCDEGVLVRYPLTRQRLALEIGAVRRSVDRGLAALVDERLLSVSSKGWKVLHDLEALRARLPPGPSISKNNRSKARPPEAPGHRGYHLLRLHSGALGRHA